MSFLGMNLSDLEPSHKRRGEEGGAFLSSEVVVEEENGIEGW